MSYRQVGRALLILVLLACISHPLLAGPIKVRKTETTFDSGKKSIHVELFEPVVEGKTAERLPAIVLLHDSAGLNVPMPGPLYQICSRILAREGYVVVLVHYFDRTGHKRVTPKEVSKELFLAWKSTVSDAVKYAAKQKQVDAARIGVLGFSLGAYLGLSVAADKDLNIAAVGEFFGALHDGMQQRLQSFPPTLIVHGDKDEVVPVDNAYKLKKLLDGEKRKSQLQIYAGQAHMFQGESLTGKVLADVQRSTLLFFATHLKKQADNRGK